MYNFHQLCDEHPDILTTDVWVTIGFTYYDQKYCLIKEYYGHRLCLGCAKWILPSINAFCYECKAPQPPDWTTGNKSLDLFIMESWSNTKNERDTYIQWIEYSLLTDHGCTHIATMNESTREFWLATPESTRVTLKQIVIILSCLIFIR